MHCADCGAWLDPDLDFCQSCGWEASGHQKCPNCGEELREDPDVCSACNWEVEECPNCGEELRADRSVHSPGEECSICNWRAWDDDFNETTVWPKGFDPVAAEVIYQ